MLTKLAKTTFVVLSIPVLVLVFFCMLAFTTFFAAIRASQEIIENIWK